MKQRRARCTSLASSRTSWRRPPWVTLSRSRPRRWHDMSLPPATLVMCNLHNAAGQLIIAYRRYDSRHANRPVMALVDPVKDQPDTCDLLTLTKQVQDKAASLTALLRCGRSAPAPRV